MSEATVPTDQGSEDAKKAAEAQQQLGPPPSKYDCYRKLEAARAFLQEHETTWIAWDVFSLQQPKISEQISTAGVAANKYGGIDFWFNPYFLDTLTVEELAFVMAHEAMHVTSGHVYTHKENHILWNICCDIVVNTWLYNAAEFHIGEELRKALWDAQKINMDPNRLLQFADAEDLYNAFQDKLDVIQQWIQVYGDQMLEGDVGKGAPQPGQGEQADQPGGSTPGEGEPTEGDGEGEGSGPGKGEGDDEDGDKPNLGDGSQRSAGGTADEHEGWGKVEQHHVKDLLDRVKARNSGGRGWSKGGRGGFGMFRAFEEVEQNFNWERELQRFIGSVRHFEDTWERPNKRAIPFDATMPTQRVIEKYQIIGYVDVSGSIGDEELNRFITVLKHAPKDVKITLFTFDTGVYEWPGWKEGSKPKVVTGGTDFDVVVEHAEACPIKADAYVVLTDGWCSEPEPKRPRKWMWVSTDQMLTAKSGHWVKMPDYSRRRR